MAVKVEKGNVKHKTIKSMADVTVKHGVSKLLQERFNVSAPTVRRALNGTTKSNLANRIREAAIKEYEGRTDRTERVIVYKQGRG